MSRLHVDILGKDVFGVAPGAEVYLDRAFLDPRDGTLSRAPHAPCLRFRDGEWWLDNDSRDDTYPVTVFSEQLNRRVAVPSQCGFRLRPGDNTVHVWRQKHRVRLEVPGSGPVSAARPAGDEPTLAGLSEAQERIQRLFREKPHIRMILVALYRNYLTEGFDRPAELSRSDVAKCINGTQDQVSEAKRAAMAAIWGDQGHAEELPGWLMRYRLISRTDQHLVPHHGCDHPRPRAVLRGQARL